MDKQIVERRIRWVVRLRSLELFRLQFHHIFDIIQEQFKNLGTQYVNHTLRTISKEEGVFGLYKGLGATLLGVGPNLAISFCAYDTMRSYWLSHRPSDSTVLVSLACGSLSGVASSTEKQVKTQALPVCYGSSTTTATKEQKIKAIP